MDGKKHCKRGYGMEFEFKAKKENRLVAWFKRLSGKKKALLITAIVLLLMVAVVAGYVMSKFSKLDREEFEEDEIIINDTEEEIGVGYTNFVLFGADSRTNDVTNDLNTDAIMIISLNNETKEVKIVSVYRDTLMDVKNNNIQKCNSAYRRGGAKQAINMLNMNLDMNIQKYVTVNWSAVSDVVDMLGGVTVDVTEAEMKAMNNYIGETATVANKKAVFIKKAGIQTLDGVQATTYARIRKGVGDDFARTGRQRELIKLVLEKAVKADLGTIDSIIDTVFPQISTNFSMTEIIKYVKDVAKYDIIESSGFPFEKDAANLGKRGSCTFAIDLTDNVKKLHEVLFGVEDYEPSSKVKSISAEIDEIIRTTKGSSSTTSGNKTTTEEETGTTTEKTTEHKTTTTEETTTEATSTAAETTTTEASATETETTTTEEQIGRAHV